VRGKHGNAAKNRRDRAELEQRAETAEHRAERAEKELSTLRESSERSVSALRSELSQARKDRDTAVAPALADAEAQIRTLITQRDEAQRERKEVQERWERFLRTFRDVLADLGVGQAEAIEAILASVTPDGAARTVLTDENASMRKATTEQIIAIQRARGERGTVDRLAHRKARALEGE